MSVESLTTLEALQQNSNWDIENINSDDLERTVRVIHLCALRNEHNEGDEVGEPPTNHWTMCLQCSSTSCVMLDIVPGFGSDGLRGKIEMTSIGDSPYTDETLHPFSYKPSREFTVRYVIWIISEKGRDKFNFSAEWEGCRFWLSVVMKDLEDDDLVDEGSALRAMEALRRYWINPEGSEPRVLRQGLFRCKQQASSDDTQF